MSRPPEHPPSSGVDHMTRPSLNRSKPRLFPRLAPILLVPAALLASACTDVDPGGDESSQGDPAAEGALGTAFSALTTSGAQRFTPSVGTGDLNCTGSHYGYGLAVGRFNGDGIDDI